jgi:hypothetical protein
VPKNNKKFGKRSAEKKADNEERKDRKKVEYEFVFDMDEFEEIEDVFGKGT